MASPSGLRENRLMDATKRSKTLHIVTCLNILSLLWLSISLCTPHWLEADQRLYNNHFDKVGLWVFCFRSFTDPKRRYHQYFASCRWFFDYEWKFMYDVIAPGFFIAVQVTYTIGFVLLLIALAFLSMLWIQSFPRHEPELLYAASFTNAASSFWFFVAYTTFAANAYDANWLPGWQNNYLSWSFAFCVIGGLKLLVCSMLFYVEAGRRAEKIEFFKASDENVELNVTTKTPENVESSPTRSRQSLV